MLKLCKRSRLNLRMSRLRGILIYLLLQKVSTIFFQKNVKNFCGISKFVRVKKSRDVKGWCGVDERRGGRRRCPREKIFFVLLAVHFSLVRWCLSVYPGRVHPGTVAGYARAGCLRAPRCSSLLSHFHSKSSSPYGSSSLASSTSAIIDERS